MKENYHAYESIRQLYSTKSNKNVNFKNER